MSGARVIFSMKTGRITALAHNQEQLCEPLIAGSAQDRLIGETEHCRFLNLARIAEVHHETFASATSTPIFGARQGRSRPESEGKHALSCGLMQSPARGKFVWTNAVGRGESRGCFRPQREDPAVGANFLPIVLLLQIP